jgi:hypothetical protein
MLQIEHLLTRYMIVCSCFGVLAMRPDSTHATVLIILAIFNPGEISGSHDCEYEDDSLLGLPCLPNDGGSTRL